MTRSRPLQAREGRMIQADLHVHSRHSRHPSEWFLQRIGAQESYTDVEDVYRMAKARGWTVEGVDPILREPARKEA